MQQVAVQPISVEAGERALAGLNGPGTRGVLGKDLGDQKDLVAPPGDRLADDLFSVAVHLRGVYMVHAEIDAPAQRGDRQGAVAGIDVPGPLADHRDLVVGGTELTNFHVSLHESDSFPLRTGNLMRAMIALHLPVRARPAVFWSLTPFVSTAGAPCRTGRSSRD